MENMRTERVSAHMNRRIEILRLRSNKGFDEAIRIPVHRMLIQGSRINQEALI